MIASMVMGDMDGGTATKQGWASSGQGLLCVCWLGLLLLLTHQAAMASAQCAVAMGPLHGHVAMRSGPMLSTPPLPPPTVPATRGDCPAQQAVFPVLALLLLLLIVVRGRPTGRHALPGGVPHHGEPAVSYPPPLAARRRRALLQVFLI